MVLSEASFLAGNYPKDTPKVSFKEKTISEEIWDQLEKDFSEENQLQAQMKGESTLNKEEQLKLLVLVSQNGCDQWRLIAEQMGLKNRREAIIEFLRIKVGSQSLTQTEKASQQKVEDADALEKDFLFKVAQKVNLNEEEKPKDLKEIKPYNQADMYMTHCDMLINFGQSEDSFKKPYGKDKKQKAQKTKMKKDLANRLIMEKISQMSSELCQIQSLDDSLSKMRQEQKNLQC